MYSFEENCSDTESSDHSIGEKLLMSRDYKKHCFIIVGCHSGQTSQVCATLRWDCLTISGAVQLIKWPLIILKNGTATLIDILLVLVELMSAVEWERRTTKVRWPDDKEVSVRCTSSTVPYSSARPKDMSVKLPLLFICWTVCLSGPL